MNAFADLTPAAVPAAVTPVLEGGIDGWKLPSLSGAGVPLGRVKALACRPEKPATRFLLFAVSWFVIPPTAGGASWEPPRMAAAALAVASAPPTVWSTFSD